MNRRAVELAPLVIRLYLGLGTVLDRRGDTGEAIRVLEQGLARAIRDDWTDTMRARGLLARLYRDAGQPGLAAAQYRAILTQRQSYAADELEAARRFLAGRP